MSNTEISHKFQVDISPRLKVAFKILFYFLSLFTLLRIAFYLAFAGQAADFSRADATHAFITGFRFDLRLAVCLTLPALFISFKKRSGAILYSFLQFWVLLIYAGDIGYYAYLESRINSRIFEFLKNFGISLEMVWQTYNVPLWSLLIAVLLVFNFYFLKKYIFLDSYSFHDSRRTRTKIIERTCLSVAVLLSLHTSLDQYPLRWSEAFFTQNNFISQLSMNPIHYLVDTSFIVKKDFDINKVKKSYDTTARYLGVVDLDSSRLNYQRPIEFSPETSKLLNFQPGTMPNVIYIVMESMVAYKTGVFGNNPDSTPALDSLANSDSSWLFKNFYVPTEGTARSMFCVLTGVPDINAKSTSSRNPLIVDQHTLINGLQNYDKYYFIGGSASWGNIRGVYINNVKDLQMYEGDRLNASNTDVWGLSDLDLFRETAKVLRVKNSNNDKPFFALIQSASYHRPYTIPKDHGDFQLKNLSAEELKKFGFASNEEYNSFRMADYSLGEFFKLIKDDPYFKNTIFVIHGDHGLPHHSAEHLTAGYKFYGLNRFHTPLVIYSPLISQRKEWNMMVTEPDVMPTLLGLLGLNYTNTALGRNIFAIPDNQPRYAFSYVYYTDPLQIMLYDQEHIVVGTENEITSLHKYNTADFERDLKNEMPDKFKEMQDILEGIFETSKYILQNNQKIKTKH